MEGGEESDDHNEYNFISSSTVFVSNSAAASIFLNLTLIINLPFSRNFDISQCVIHLLRLSVLTRRRS